MTFNLPNIALLTIYCALGLNQESDNQEVKVDWGTDFEASVKTASKTKKPIVVNVSDGIEIRGPIWDKFKANKELINKFEWFLVDCDDDFGIFCNVPMQDDFNKTFIVFPDGKINGFNAKSHDQAKELLTKLAKEYKIPSENEFNSAWSKLELIKAFKRSKTFKVIAENYLNDKNPIIRENAVLALKEEPDKYTEELFNHAIKETNIQIRELCYMYTISIIINGLNDKLIKKLHELIKNSEDGQLIDETYLKLCKKNGKKFESGFKKRKAYCMNELEKIPKKR